MLFDSTIIVCQGNFEFEYHKPIIDEYKDLDNILFSTWGDCYEFLISMGVDNKKILISDKPENPGKSNANLQFKSSYKGFESVHSKYKYGLKIRSDLLISKQDVEKLINLFDPTKTYFTAWHNHDSGYLCEHIVFGEMDKLLDLFKIYANDDGSFPERRLTNRYLELMFPVSYIFPILYKYGIKCYWTKRSFYLNEYINDGLFVYDFKPS